MKNNFYFFIYRKLTKSDKNTFSSTISKVAIISSAISIFIILISFAILLGFQNNIKDKIFSFGGHIQLTKYDLNQSLLENPILLNKEFIVKCKKNPAIKDIHVYSIKPGIVKVNGEVSGIVLKGVDESFKNSTFQRHIKQGRFVQWNDSTGAKEIVISEKASQKLNLKLGDDIIVFFIQEPPKFRKLKIVGVFNTGMEEFDENIMFGDIQLVRRLNNWPNNLIGGYEIVLSKFDNLDAVSAFIFDLMDYDLGLEKITDKYIAVFDWLSLLNQNVKIFLILILVVACFNVVSCLLILIMERTNMIGILKTMGAQNSFVIKLFLYQGIILIMKGLALGNLLAALFCFLQYQFNIIPLNAENYYMDSVPIEWSLVHWLLSNVVLFILMSVSLIVPTLVTLRISPSKAIKFA